AAASSPRFGSWVRASVVKAVLHRGARVQMSWTRWLRRWTPLTAGSPRGGELEVGSHRGPHRAFWRHARRSLGDGAPKRRKWIDTTCCTSA
ncbi:unnamed protein product, partial [Symbiodinium sp. CCMP2456]